MSYAARVYQVMVASPSDVVREREIAAETIYEWNVVNSAETSTVLLPARWETHAAPLMGDRPQEVINKFVLDESDLLVGVFWGRLGTPTGVAESGTVEEIERHMEAGKPAMLYFSQAPILEGSVDPAEFERLLAFREFCKERGLYETYDSPQEFGQIFRRQLSITVNKHDYFKGRSGEAVAIPIPVPVPVGRAGPADGGKDAGLSREAKALLIEAAQDRSGTIMHIRTMGGTLVQTNNKKFVERGNPRSEATWIEAIAQLERLGLISEQGYKGELYSVTAEGYKVADALAAENGG